MLSADQAFRDVANRAAAAYAARPAFVSYQTHVHVDVPAFNRSRDVNRAVEVRTADDTAVLQDLPHGRRQVAHAFPIVPTFDALSYFRLYGFAGPRTTLESYVSDVRPITFDNVASHADVVVTSLKYYRAAYASDSVDGDTGKTHIVLDALKTLTQYHNGDFYLRDVYIDNADPQRLPSRVTWISPPPENWNFTCDYARRDGNWVIDHVHYEQSVSVPLHLARFRVIADGTFDTFAFPAAPVAKELAPKPAG